MKFSLVFGAAGLIGIAVANGATVSIPGTAANPVSSGIGPGGFDALAWSIPAVNSLSQAINAARVRNPLAAFTSTGLDYPGNGAVLETNRSWREFLGVDHANSQGGLGSLGNAVVQIVGYVNVTRAGTYDFIVGADDGFSFNIGGVEVARREGQSEWQDTRFSVRFAQAGLYEVETVYWSGPTNHAGIDVQSTIYGDRAGRTPGYFVFGSVPERSFRAIPTPGGGAFVACLLVVSARSRRRR